MTQINPSPSRRCAIWQFPLFSAALLTVVCWSNFATEPARGQSPFPATVQTQTPRIVGRWSGKTAEDGILTVVVYPAPGKQLVYEFSGGAKEHATGTFTLRGANELNFTPEHATEAEKWTYTFDEQGKLHLTMEEDNPQDQEEYILSRAEQ
jgi:hypothetical protein